MAKKIKYLTYFVLQKPQKWLFYIPHWKDYQSFVYSLQTIWVSKKHQKPHKYPNSKVKQRINIHPERGLLKYERPHPTIQPGIARK